jgi:hypothetical protein
MDVSAWPGRGAAAEEEEEEEEEEGKEEGEEEGAPGGQKPPALRTVLLSQRKVRVPEEESVILRDAETTSTSLYVSLPDRVESG